MEFSSFDAPSLPPPDGLPAAAGPRLPAPAAGRTLPPPAASSDAAPAAAAVPTLPPPAEPVTVAKTVAPPSSPPPADRPSPRPRRSRRGLLLVAVVALAAVGVGAWQLTGDDGEAGSGDGPTAERVDPPDGGETIGDIGAGAIQDATALVEEIDERSEADELLAELGLGPDGEPRPEPQPEPPVLAEPAGYAFAWTGPGGTRIAALVDATTGDYAIDGSDGVAVRVVGGVPYGRVGGEWQLTDLSVLGGIAVPGLDGFPSIERVIGPAVEPFVELVTMRTDADGTTFGYLVDDSALFAADPAGREAWLGPWGLLDGHRPPASADPALFTEAWTAAGPGQVIVSFTVSPTDELVRVTVDSPAIGGVAVLDELATSPDAPTIDLPD